MLIYFLGGIILIVTLVTTSLTYHEHQKQTFIFKSKTLKGFCYPFLQKEEPYSISLLLLLFQIVFLLLSGKFPWLCSLYYCNRLELLLHCLLLLQDTKTEYFCKYFKVKQTEIKGTSWITERIKNHGVAAGIGIESYYWEYPRLFLLHLLWNSSVQ